MGKEIRTRRIEKNIKAIDKGAVAADRLKQAYVRTKDSAGLPQEAQESQERSYTEIWYAQDKITAAAGKSVRQSARGAGKLCAHSLAGVKGKGAQFREGIKNRRRQEQRQNALMEQMSQRIFKEHAERSRRFQGQASKDTRSTADISGGAGNAYEVGRKDAKVVFKTENFIKTSSRQFAHKPAGTVQAVQTAQMTMTYAPQTARDAAKKTYIKSKIPKDMSARVAQNTGKTTKTAGQTAKISIKAGASAAKATIASTKSLVTAMTAGGSAAAFLLIFVILFGGFLYTVGGGNSSAASPVSEEVERYEPLIRKYANKYGIGEYVELIKAVMMQESGGRGLDPMQSSEGAFNKRYPRQPNGIKNPEYSIDCGVQELKAALVKAEVKSPIDMEHIKLALQGYNFGSGYISWAVRKYGGYTTSNAAEFSDMMARRMGWSRYGDKEYVSHVLRYYAFGRIPTGTGSQSIVQVALSQEGNKGGQPYWSWYGYHSRVSWCACFVSWCANQCGYIENGTIPKFSSCASGASWFKEKGRFKDRSYVPSPGDIIFFDWGAGVHHVGIVVDVKNGKVNTIEGNSGNAVKRRSYRIEDGRIHGYGIYAF